MQKVCCFTLSPLFWGVTRRIFGGMFANNEADEFGQNAAIIRRRYRVRNFLTETRRLMYIALVFLNIYAILCYINTFSTKVRENEVGGYWALGVLGQLCTIGVIVMWADFDRFEWLKQCVNAAFEKLCQLWAQFQRADGITENMDDTSASQQSNS